MKELRPCQAGEAQIPVDLVFWFHKSIQCNPSVIATIEEMLQAMPNVRSCFQDVLYLSAEIPTSLDFYGDGTIMMFYRLFRHPLIRSTSISSFFSFLFFFLVSHTH
jgi:hypothetical protein